VAYPGNNYRGNQGVVAPGSTSNGVFYVQSQVMDAKTRQVTLAVTGMT
jgi:hypothetical protein